MSLSTFIRDHHEEIISEFAVFARTLMPPGANMTEAELRDHAEAILTAVVGQPGGDHGCTVADSAPACGARRDTEGKAEAEETKGR